MNKRLCKLNRHEIAEQLGDIQRLVSAPKFVCRSCARAAQDKSMLCKPLELQAVAAPMSPPQQALVTMEVQPDRVEDLTQQATPTSLTKTQLKQAQKQAKKQKKYFKQLKKTVNKQQKLLLKQQKLALQWDQANLSFNQLAMNSDAVFTHESLH